MNTNQTYVSLSHLVSPKEPKRVGCQNASKYMALLWALVSRKNQDHH